MSDMNNKGGKDKQWTKPEQNQVQIHFNNSKSADEFLNRMQEWYGPDIARRTPKAYLIRLLMLIPSLVDLPSHKEPVVLRGLRDMDNVTQAKTREDKRKEAADPSESILEGIHDPNITAQVLPKTTTPKPFGKLEPTKSNRKTTGELSTAFNTSEVDVKAALAEMGVPTNPAPNGFTYVQDSYILSIHGFEEAGGYTLRGALKAWDEAGRPLYIYTPPPAEPKKPVVVPTPEVMQMVGKTITAETPTPQPVREQPDAGPSTRVLLVVRGVKSRGILPAKGMELMGSGDPVHLEVLKLLYTGELAMDEAIPLILA